MTAPEIQIAFQGGGAKFIAMLPVAEAFQFCEAHGRIQIKAVAGTSAGAICAALIAAKCDFPSLRTYLAAAGSGHVRKLVGNSVTQLTAVADATGWAARISAVYGAAPLLKSVIRTGDPLFKEAEFGVFLDQILAHCADKDKVIEQLDKSLSIVTTDLASSGGKIIETGSIKTALRDSCALPVAFRSFKYLSINHHVDGGLCDNLPVESLTDPKAPIFAVFPEETSDRKPIDNVFMYLLSLIGAAIDNNVKRSRAKVSDAFQIPIQTSFSTFDFEEALVLLRDEKWYENLKNKTIDLITDFSLVHGRINKSTQYRVDDTRNLSDYMDTMAIMALDQADYAKMTSSRLTVTINCADTREDGAPVERRPADSVTKETILIVKSDKFRCFITSLYTPSKAPSIWRAYNRTKNTELPIKVLSLDTQPVNANNRRCLVEFLGPDSHISTEDEIEISDIFSRKDAMIKMNSRREEFASLTNPYGHPLELAEIVVAYPAALGRFDLVNDSEKGDVADSDVTISEAKLEGSVYKCTISCRDLAPKSKLHCRIVPRH
ncbi:putative acylesterase/phospholipase RssA [Methylobacterium fujisawaense]|uniref:Acylesterase/phospholipase RssA n=1 Tax=Methylobacterium fujisawaense TaxID=107400 RepID=A0ABR6D6C0_9HYPH|nr:patatin-like phospholipase family protein [Methylobacterium fujisawaense]MBA9061611.1 putative acylesterase/phospholipase RssA [Methylobacterium fujisawaense]